MKEKIKVNYKNYRYRRQAENDSAPSADLSDGIDVEVSLEVASSVETTNSQNAINVRP